MSYFKWKRNESFDGARFWISASMCLQKSFRDSSNHFGDFISWHYKEKIDFKTIPFRFKNIDNDCLPKGNNLSLIKILRKLPLG